MAFGVVLRDLLAAANYCALADPSPEREELLTWLGGAARRVRHMAQESGRESLVFPLTRLARTCDAARSDPALIARLPQQVCAAFDAHDPPGRHPLLALAEREEEPPPEELTRVLRWSSRGRAAEPPSPLRSEEPAG